MARTIDYFGNVIFVTAAGTCDYENLSVATMYVWAANTTGRLVITDVTSGAAMQLLSYSCASHLPVCEWLGVLGNVGKISFDTVTACSAWIIKR